MTRLFAPLIALVVALAAVGGLSAQVDSGQSTFVVAPEPGEDPATTEEGYFHFELAPGSETEGSIRLQNTSSVPETIQLAAVDATTAQGGGGSYASADVEPSRAGAWLQLTETSVHLEPDEQVSVAFSVRLPESVQPGQYLAGIAAYIPVAEASPVATPEASQAGAAVIVQPRSVVSVQFDVLGEWTSSLQITGASALEQESGTRFGIILRNDGDTFLQPEGSMILRNAAATPIATESIRIGTFLPGTELTHSAAWPGPPEPGDYGVAVELNYGEGQVARYNGTLSVSEDAPAAPDTSGAPAEPTAVAQPEAEAPAPAPALIQPWMIYAIGGLLVLIIILLALILLRGRRRSDW